MSDSPLDLDRPEAGDHEMLDQTRLADELGDGPEDRGTLGTSPTLLDDVRKGDAAAWTRLDRLYRPLIAHWLRRNGVAQADLDDMEQDLLMVLCRRLPEWVYDRARGSFRAYVKTIVRNAGIKYRLRRARDQKLGLGGVGGTDHEEVVRAQTASAVDNSNDDDPFDLGFHRRVLELACEQVRTEVSAKTWAVFEQVDLLHRPDAEVAAEFGIRVGNLYVMRSRVRARLARHIEGMNV